MDEEVTATYAGLRAAIDADDYLIDLDVAPALPPGRRHPLDRAHGRAWPSPSTSPGCSPRAAWTSPLRDDLPDAAPDAEPRRGRARALPGGRTDRGRPGVRPRRLLLRTRDRGRDPRRVRLDHPAGGSRRAPPPHPRPERPLSGLLLRRPRPRACWPLPGPSPRPPRSRHDRRALEQTSRSSGSGSRSSAAAPSGLTAAAALAGQRRRRGAGHRARGRAGGIPRHSDHLGYGVRDLRRFVSGPSYARRLTETARDAGAQLHTQAPGHRLGRRPASARDLASGPPGRRGRRRRPGHRRPRTAAVGPTHPRRPAGRRVHDRRAAEPRPPRSMPRSGGVRSWSARSWSAGRRC